MRIARTGLLVVLAVTVGACTAVGGGTEEPARFDFGPLPEPLDGDGASVLVERVRAPVWLQGPDIVYRGLGNNGRALARYARNQWTAAPAELFEQHLEALLHGADAEAASPGEARLEVELAAFEQVFETPEDARVEARALARLEAACDARVIHRRQFSQRRDAAPDVDGAVAGLADAAAALGRDIASWAREQAGDCSR